MTAQIPAETHEYRVVLVDPASRAVCVPERGDEHCLLRIAVTQETRPVRDLQKALREVWSLSVIILDFLRTVDRTSMCAVAELLHREIPPGFHAVHADQLSEEDLSEQERDSLQSMLEGEASTQLAKVGWIDNAIAWLETTTGAGVLAKAEVEQYNAGGGFALIRFRMESGRSYWLKATGAPNTHERAVTTLLSRLGGGYVPEVIAERPDWNAWLMGDNGDLFPARTRDMSRVVPILEGAVKSLAELQMRTMGSELDLLEAGASDHRTDVLRSTAKTLFAYIGEAMDAQTSTKVPRIPAKRLHDLQSLFVDVCSDSEDLELPDMVLHGDLNFGNILIAQERCVFVDWCEAYIGNPLVTFEHLLLLNPIEDGSLKAACNQRLREVYRTAMSRLCHPGAINAGFACMPLLAAASTILARGDWLQTSLRNDPRRQAYVRAIARHMDRAARNPLLLERLSV
jgi:hypothetical protein